MSTMYRDIAARHRNLANQYARHSHQTDYEDLNAAYSAVAEAHDHLADVLEKTAERAGEGPLLDQPSSNNIGLAGLTSELGRRGKQFERR